MYKYTIYTSTTRHNQPSLLSSLVVGLLGEDAVYHRDEQHPRRTHRGATKPSGDGVRRPATQHVSNVLWFNGLLENSRQTRENVTPALTVEHCTLHHRQDRYNTHSSCPLPKNPAKASTEHPIPDERLRCIK